MADPKAGATSEKKEKSSVLDEDIGNDILTSWKSISVNKDGEDFNLEPIGKSKKKDFSFGKLDMDFDLGGDFNKISSFKMDMSDLNFSFSPKKNKKATETVEGDFGRVNKQRREDRFNFSFDFDNFDFDATLSKVDALSSRQKDIQKHVTDKTDFQESEIQYIEVTTADNKPQKVHASEAVEAEEVQVLTDDHGTLITGNYPLSSDTTGDIVSQLGADTSSDKAVYNGGENAIDPSYLTVDQPIILDFDVQRMPANKLGLGCLKESPEEGSSSVELVNTTVGGNQSICYEAASEAVQQNPPEHVLPKVAESLEGNSKGNTNLSDSNDKVPSIFIEEVTGWGSDSGRPPMSVLSKTSELSKDNNDGKRIVSNTSADVSESSDDISDSHDPSVASAGKILRRESKTQLFSFTSREPMLDKSAAGIEKDLKLVRSNFFGKSDEIDEPIHESSVYTKSKSLDMSTMHSDSPPKIQDATAHEGEIGVTAEDCSVSHQKAAKGEHTLLRNLRTLITTKENSLQINSSKSKEKINEKEPQKSEKANVTSVTDSTQSIRHISTAKDKSLPLKSVTRNLGLADLKSSRSTAEKKLQSISATTNEIKSFTELNQKVTEHITPKLTALNLMEKQKPGTPSLKRKQAPMGGLVHEIPLKRLSQSPKNNSINNVLDMKIKDQVQQESNTMDINTSSHFLDVPKILKFDTPGQMNSNVLEIRFANGDFGMVEKAAAYGKDLDDLCNMLKKKNEEAKELLVRAVVNNNNLLLLNHPMHDDKIRSIQKLANRLMDMEIVPRLR